MKRQIDREANSDKQAGRLKDTLWVFKTQVVTLTALTNSYRTELSISGIGQASYHSPSGNRLA